VRVEQLYEKLGGKIYRFLCIKLQSDSDAEDVLQEVFCRLIHYRVRLALLRKPAAFALTLARNEANRFLSKKARESQKCRKVALDGVLQHVFVEREPGSISQLASALENIPAEQREVIFLRFFEDLSFKEIASICEVSISTAASRYRYGLEKIGRIIGARYDD